MENVFDSTFPNPPTIRTTSGEILADGSILDIVSIANKLQLYHWNKGKEVVASVLKLDNTIYELPRLDRTLLEVLKFPSGQSEYGSAGELFTTAQSVFLEKGFSVEAAGWGSLFALTSWITEAVIPLPTLLIYSSDLRAAEIFVSMLSCICRRPFLSAQLSRALPFELRPTLLIMTADLSAKGRAFWSAVNVRGVRVPAKNGRVETFASARALVVQDPEQLRAWGPEVWQLSLISERQVSPATDLELARISGQLQNRFFSFRLQHLLQTNANTPVAKLAEKFKNCQAPQLLAIAQDDCELLRKITPLIEQQQRDFVESQQRDPHRAIVEVLWPRAHKANDVSVAKILEAVNALLNSRGASFDFDERTLGWRLRELALERKRNSKGKFLRFSSDMRRQIHRLARGFALDLPKSEGCRDCEEMI